MKANRRYLVEKQAVPLKIISISKFSRYPPPRHFCYVLQLKDLQRSVVYVLQIKDLPARRGINCVSLQPGVPAPSLEPLAAVAYDSDDFFLLRELYRRARNVCEP